MTAHSESRRSANSSILYVCCSDSRTQTEEHRKAELALVRQLGFKGKCAFVCWTGPSKAIINDEGFFKAFSQAIDLIDPGIIIIEGHSRCKVYMDQSSPMEQDAKQVKDMILAKDKILRHHPEKEIHHFWAELPNNEGTSIKLTNILLN